MCMITGTAHVGKYPWMVGCTMNGEGFLRSLQRTTTRNYPRMKATMPLRREDPGFWTWFTENHAYSQEEAAYLPSEFVKTDDTFDTWMWEMWVEARKEEYEATKVHV